MSKRKVSVEDKTYAVNLYLDGKESQRRIADMFDVSLASVQQWIRNYESMGANAFTLKGKISGFLHDSSGCVIILYCPNL